MQEKEYKGFYNIVKNASKKEATIYIYGLIGGWDFDSYRPINTAKKFVSDFKEVEKIADVIHIKINSPGGYIHDGLPIYNTIKNSDKEVRTYVDGIAYSMASLIALAGDKVYGYNNSMFMFHNGSSYFRGNSKEMREQAEVLDIYDQALGTIIEEKLNISSDEVKEKYLNYSDNFFTAKKAKEIGFFDEIITSKKADVPKDIKNMSAQAIMNHYSKFNFTAQENNPKTTQTMSKLLLPLIEATLGDKFTDEEQENGVFLTEDNAKALEEKLSENDKVITASKKDITSFEKKITNLETSQKALNTAIQNALKNAEVEDAKELSNEKGIQALSNLIEKYGKEDSKETTSVMNTPDDNNVADINVIGGIDISAAMNN